ncbi:hypothetical protein NCCP2716_04260 [Sporosarcina sp. NCCP-2716]|uniref:metallophosphoesterase n=1 Tax=Sporosarcina sp. NCCP-2716 TaxID=2943679 RepID=UPI00203BFE29|nr:metallophosphoesterase [Sporosarcina sp. NCCP-2716]GKV67928.1 hypothetical protein NCCP2716_04260 [Sporosarcina sp. NCCP-2716]
MKNLWIAADVLLTGAGVLLASMLWSAHRVTVKRQHMSVSTDADEELTVFFISDIHRRRVPGRLLRKVRSSGKPVDLVIIGGDLAEKGVPEQRVQRNVERLAGLGPVFYIWGNNDREIGEERIRAIIAESGGKVLDNESVRLPGHPDWIISGADDPSSGNANITKTASFSGAYMHQLIAVHNPSSFRKFLDLTAPSLLVGGHTHGGQIRFGPFGMQPRGKFKELGSHAELISNGFGTTLVPLRFGAPPETHLITVQYKKRSGRKQHEHY